jgi:glycosyltransferase involved in cell wall biosynthesis
MISVIIPTKNEEEHLTYCLRSLQTQNLDRNEYEIIVVDGNSSDSTQTIAERYADRLVVQRHMGIGGARKDGVLASCGDLLVFTDADTLHRADWLEIIQRNLTSGSNDVCTGPILFYDKNLRAELLQLWRKQYNILHLFNFYWLIGSNMAMKRTVYEKINGHREISILDDYDISVRMFKEGDIRCLYDPTQEVYTSARRLTNLLTYFMIFLYGHYHYHITHDYRRLLSYPHFDEMDLNVMIEVLGIGEMNKKLADAAAKFASPFEKKEPGMKEDD